MKRKYDVIVIGGGPVGLSAAYFCARRGMEVLVVERDAVGYGTASASAGMMVPSHIDPLNTRGNIKFGLASFTDPDSPVRISARLDIHYLFWVLKFFQKSMSLAHFHRAVAVWQALNPLAIEVQQELAALGGPEYQYESNGHLALYITHKAFAHARRDSDRLAAGGVENHLLSGAEARKLDPAVGPGVVGAVRVPGDAHMAPRAFLQWLAREATAGGADILAHTEAYGFDTRGRMVTSVKTTNGVFRADQVVLATGAWLPMLTGLLGRRLPIEGAKGYSLTVKRPDDGFKFPFFLEDKGLVVTPYRDTLRIISRLDFTGLNPAIDAALMEPMIRLAGRYAPSLAGAEVMEVRRGIRPCCVDGLPVVGRLFKVGNVLVGGGHDQKGLTQGPLAGLHLSRLLAGEHFGDLEQALRPARLWEK